MKSGDLFFLALIALPCGVLAAQQGGGLGAHSASPQIAAPKTADPKIHRLILKDGTYQVVTRYEIAHDAGGDRVRYISAERGGEWEELPVSLVDWAATQKYARDHAGNTSSQSPDDTSQDPGHQEAAAIDEEERAERSRDLEVAPGLRLPVETGIWALDIFHDQPELVELTQSTGDVNRQTGHNVTRSALGANGTTRQTLELNERHAKAALHGSQPALYVSVDAAGDSEPSSTAVTVDTGGASAKGPEAVSSPTSRYVILRAEVRKEYRFVGTVRVDAFNTGLAASAATAAGTASSQNALPTRSEMLAARRWLKLTPKDPLTPGDYVLMEVLSPKEVNMSVWDFRIDPGAPDNDNAILPLQRYKMDH